MPDKRTVVVTGFGPFGEHTTNASWVAAQEMAKLEFPNDILLVTLEMPVEYEAVQKMVPDIWDKYKPYLVVHLGVSGIASELTLEQLGHNSGYDRLDVCQKVPEPPICKSNGPDCITSSIDMTSICNDINSSDCGVKAVVSTFAGRYLCEYAYYSSLHQDRSRTAFIHVPPLDKPYTAQQLALGIREAIISMLKHVAPSTDS